MMSLYDLVNSVTIQGDVRISFWNDDEEVVLLEENGTDDLCYEVCGAGGDVAMFDCCKVKYIFSAGDGYIHIELDEEDALEVHNELMVSEV